MYRAMALTIHLTTILLLLRLCLLKLFFYAIPFAGTQVPLIVIWLIIAASVFTAYFGFLNFKGFNHAVKVIKGDYSNPNDPGEVSHFQALTTALSGTVGLGNIAGVAIAVSIGGPGATFLDDSRRFTRHVDKIF